MKYEFGDYEKDEIIEDYITITGQQNIISVAYLDGHSDMLPYTLKNLKEIRDKMLQQAKERSEYSKNEGNNANIDLQNELVMDLIGASMSAAGIVMVQPKDLETTSIVVSAMFTGTFSILLHNFIKKIYNNVIEQNAKEKDIEKYDIYLAIREFLINHKDNLKLTDREKKLDINTIDRYSLKEVKKLQKTLEKCDAFKEFA